MLTYLSIHNYALINQLSIDFTKGFSAITGETGAGKSIILGALGLVTGNRADLSALKASHKKCVVEAQFSLKGYGVKDMFKELDIDYDEETIIRREILPSGKSRAFVNDTPVKLSVLSTLKTTLVDIHSQYQTLQLSDEEFQYTILDALAKQRAKVASYQRGLSTYHSLKKELKYLREEAQKSTEQYEYHVYLCTELENANLQVDEQKLIEAKLEKLTHIEDIKQYLAEALQIVMNEELGIQNQFYTLENKLQKIRSFSKEYEALHSRISSVKIELDDVISELASENEKVDFNPQELEELNDRLQLIYNLQKKHAVSSVVELQKIQQELAEKVARTQGANKHIQQKEQEIEEVACKLNALAHTITLGRQRVIPSLQKELIYLLSELGMPNAQFLIKVTPIEAYSTHGKDSLTFLFSANKGVNFGALKKVASGGELSRIMLSIKNILSKNKQLPTIIFDEIDTGVSGEVATKMASIMNTMGNYMQVITITHLPQIAAKSQQHYKVYKEEENEITTSNLTLLTYPERVAELAEMLSGKNYSESAVLHAKELLS